MSLDYTWPLPAGFDIAAYTRIRGRRPEGPKPHFTRPVAQRLPDVAAQTSPRRRPPLVPFDVQEAFLDGGQAICPTCGLAQSVARASRVVITRGERVYNVLTCGVTLRPDAETHPDSCGQRFLTFIREVEPVKTAIASVG